MGKQSKPSRKTRTQKEIALEFTNEEAYIKARKISFRLEDEGYDIWRSPIRRTIGIPTKLKSKFNEFKKKGLYVEREVVNGGEIPQEELFKLRRKYLYGHLYS